MEKYRRKRGRMRIYIVMNERMSEQKDKERLCEEEKEEETEYIKKKKKKKKKKKRWNQFQF